MVWTPGVVCVCISEPFFEVEFFYCYIYTCLQAKHLVDFNLSRKMIFVLLL